MAQVLLFGRLSDIAGWRQQTVDVLPDRLSKLKTMLAAADATLGEALDAPGVRAAVDKALVLGDAPIGHAREVAFLPPMSGG